MGQRSRQTGSKLTSKARAKYSIPTVTFSTANTTCLRSTARACTCGALTAQSTRASSKKTPCKDKQGYISLLHSTITAGLEMASVRDRATMFMRMGTPLMGSGRMI